MMNGDGVENVKKSSRSPSPMSPDAGGSNRHSFSSHDESNAASRAFVRNAIRKSLGDGLSMQKWFSAHERVLQRQHYQVRAVTCSITFSCYSCYFTVALSC